MEYEKALKAIETLETDSALEHYEAKTLEKRFEELMRLYDKLEPDWKKEYEKVEARKPKELQTPLGANNIEEVINGAIYDKLLEMCLSMHIANKIAHKLEFFKNIIIKKMLQDKVETGEISEDILSDRKKFAKVSRIISEMIDPTNENNESLIEWNQNILNRDNITSDVIQKLRDMEVGKLIKGKANAFAAKDIEITKALKALAEIKDISYGIYTKTKTDREGKTIYDSQGMPTYENLLVVDLPYYGQFSIHMKQESSISALSKIPYYGRRYIYEKETVLLTDEISPVAIKFIEREKRKGKSGTFKGLYTELREIDKVNPRYAHYLALKLGATKDELHNLHNSGKNGGNQR